MDPAVAEFFRQLDHPLRPELQSRPVLRAPQSVQVMLHLDAKVRPDIKTRLPIEDPAGLLHWLSHDRAMVKFRHWINHLR